MKVILLKDIKGTGKKGDVINASDGHARNYLIPRGLAKEGNESALSELKHHKAVQKKKKDSELKDAQILAQKISDVGISIKSKAGEGGKLFGSITSKDISESLKKDFNIEIDKRKIVLDGAIKQIGTVVVDIKVYPGVVAKLKVSITE